MIIFTIEINGILGLEQLKYIDEVNKIRNKNYLQFHNSAKENNNFQKLDLSHMSFVSNFAYPLICKDKDTFDKYKNKFIKNEIEIRPIVGGYISEQPFFKKYFTNKSLKYDCVNAKKIHNLGFYFPNNPELTNEEKEKICSLLI